MQGVKPAAAKGDDIWVSSLLITALQPPITKCVYVKGIFFSRINAVS